MKTQLFQQLRVVSFRSKQIDERWRYVCNKDVCERKKYTGNQDEYSFATCSMVCGKPKLWPYPTKKFTYGRSPVKFFREQIYATTTAVPKVSLMMEEAYDVFYENVARQMQPTREYMQKGDIVAFTMNTMITSDETELHLDTNESYSLDVLEVEGSVVVTVIAETYFGARHALETLSQLIWWDEFDDGGMLKILTDVSIVDGPKFPYRGVMVDTARNFFPLEQLKNVVVGMAACKLNVLHLHMTDSTSFPVVLPRMPKLAEYGSYGPSMVYTADDIRELIAYAKVRGVRVVVEVDAPSHVNSGWEWGPEEGLGELILCRKNIFSGQLNPDNPKALDVLESIYRDLLEITGNREIFHVGGDEVNLNCWKGSNASSSYSDMKKFWADYVSSMLARLETANSGYLPKHVVMWSSPLTSSSHFSGIRGFSNLTVQFWLGNPSPFLSSGAKVIYSTVGHWYLDCGFGRWKPDMQHGVCDPFTPWQTFYEYRPWVEHAHLNQTLGGEACLWSEQVEVDSLEIRLWPRSAAFAERVWSDPSDFGDADVYSRLAAQRGRLVERGLRAAAMWPRWCTMNPGKC